MATRKRLATRADGLTEITCPVSEEEKASREADYPIYQRKVFSHEHRDGWDTPVVLRLDDLLTAVQVNQCSNPFCAWCGKPQETMVGPKGASERYFLQGGRGDKVRDDLSDRRIMCRRHPDQVHQPGAVLNCKTDLFSNWSLAEEIQRLYLNGSVVADEPKRPYHEPWCCYLKENPMTMPEMFRKRGKSKANGQRWECKGCGKVTTAQPSVKDRYNYRQKRNRILPRIAEEMVSRTPVKRVCAKLGIHPVTYYHEMERLYTRCLEFLDEHETKQLTRPCAEIWINTDQLVYNLRNMRQRKLKARTKFDDLEELYPKVSIVITAEITSSYVLRSDLAFDCEVTLDEVEAQSRIYHDDSLYGYQRRYERLMHFPYYPFGLDVPNRDRLIKDFARRREYLNGVQVTDTYTAMAQLWLLKDTIPAKRWFIVTDDDRMLGSAVRRIFAPEFGQKTAQHFLCQVGKQKSNRVCWNKAKDARVALVKWGIDHGYDSSISEWDLATLYLAEKIESSPLYSEAIINGKPCVRLHKGQMYDHPLPSSDEGERKVTCLSDMSADDPLAQAARLMMVSNRATGAFQHQLRRSVLTLERPLLSARGPLNYSYTNYQPKYAQWMATIYRTYYNFCKPFVKHRDGVPVSKTPAEWFGVADRCYSWDDVIYGS